MMFPLANFDEIALPVANELLMQWGHRMGPLLRGNSGALQCHALFVHGHPVGVATTSSLIAPHIGGGLSHLTRENTVELSRLCAAEPWACRVVLRLWRELVLPGTDATTAISYQDADLHTGNTYRFDGWKRAAYARGTLDKRTNRQGRNRYIWVWPPSAANEVAA